MKKLFKKVVSVGLAVALTLSMAAVGISSASAANYHYADYTTITNIPTRSNCYAMEALAVGSTYLYTVKVDLSTSNCAIISKTNKNTGTITNLSTSIGATTFSYLGHANAMDVATVNDKSNLYISTMSATTNNLVRMEVDGSKINKKGAFTIRKDGEPISMPCMAITANTSTTIEFLFSRGTYFYKGSIDKNATSGYIDVSFAFKVNTKEVTVNGSVKDLSAFCWQDFGYHKGKIFVGLSGHTADKPNESAVVVYDIANASGTIKSVPNLSFYITSKAYPEKCEIEGCDISPSDGKLYFNTNRIKNGNGRNYDGVCVFNNYVYSEDVFQSNNTETTKVTEATVTESTTVSEATEASKIVETTAPPTSDYILGDVDGDGDISILDATELQKIIAGIIEPTDETNELADVNSDGKVNIKDATLIQMYIAGIIDGFNGNENSEATEPATEETTEPTTEPVTEPTTSAVTYFPACDSSYTTIATALASIGVDNSYTYRAQIAAANNITNYSGTAEQNTQMLNLLKQGKLIVP